MDIQAIRHARLHNQFLLAPASLQQVSQGLCGVQAQFFSHAQHALRLRCREAEGNALSGKLVKSWTLRGTMHLFHPADFPLFMASCGPLYRKNQWTEKSWWNQRPGWALTPQRQQYFTQCILEALEKGPLPREELKILCRQHGMTEKEEQSLFDPWGGGIREMCERGFLHYLAQEEKVFCPSPIVQPMAQEEAETELARRYFSHYGPATVHDAMYFFHAPATKVKAWMNKLPLKAIPCEGNTYYAMEGCPPPPGAIPRCLFLAGFDPLMLGYEKKETPFLPPEHMRKIFSLSGIVMPALMMDGKVKGMWKEKGNKLSITLFEPLDKGQIDALKEAAHTLWQEKTLVF